MRAAAGAALGTRSLSPPPLHILPAGLQEAKGRVVWCRQSWQRTGAVYEGGLEFIEMTVQDTALLSQFIERYKVT